MVEVTTEPRRSEEAGPVRILIVTHYADLYGANRSLLALIDGTSERSVSFHVLLPEAGLLAGELGRRNVPYSIVRFRPWYFRVSRRFRWLNRIRRARELRVQSVTNLRAEQAAVEDGHDFDLVYTNSAMTDLGYRLATRLNIPHVWHLREYGRPDYGLEFTLPAEEVRRRILFSAAVVANSQDVSDYHVGSDQHVHVIPNGVVRAGEIATEPRHFPDDRPFRFLIAGLIRKEKGQEEAIEALHRVRSAGVDATLTIAGGGGRRGVDRRVRKLGLGRCVEITGYVGDMNGLYRSSDALLMCSRSEAFGRVTAEAMSHGLPVIGRAAGGTPELIRDGDDGLLYHGSSEELARQMVRLARSPDLYERISGAAIESARAKFTIEAYAERMQKVFRSVIACRDSRELL